MLEQERPDPEYTGIIINSQEESNQEDIQREETDEDNPIQPYSVHPLKIMIHLIKDAGSPH